jgi:hypothetical protein
MGGALGRSMKDYHEKMTFLMMLQRKFMFN